MPKFLVTFDKTAFVANIADNRDGFDLTDVEVSDLSASLKAAGSFPEGILGITRVTGNPDDTIRKGEDIKTFVSIDLIVEADDIDEVWDMKPSGELLAMIGRKLSTELESIASTGWEVLAAVEYKSFVIAATNDSDTYWSNEFGWAGREHANVFTENQSYAVNLPMGGEWEEVEDDDITPAPAA